MEYFKNTFNNITKYNKYDYLFKNEIEKYYLVINKILYIIPYIQIYICNKKYSNNDITNILELVLFRNMLQGSSQIYTGFNFEYIINDKLSKNYTKKLIIANFSTIIYNYDLHCKLNNSKQLSDTLLFLNTDYNDNVVKTRIQEYKSFNNLANIYSSHAKKDYVQFLKNIIKSDKEDKANNIIPDKKYDYISCHIGHIYGINESASIRTNLDLPQYISIIGISLKYLEQNGILVIFTTIVNPNIPSYKKLMGLLNYAFNKCEIISNDINQNIFIGVPEFYIKCTGYKTNISENLINKLIQMGIDTIDYIYNVCDIIDYFNNYIQNNLHQGLFYKADNIANQSSRQIKSTHKTHTTHKTLINKMSFNISKFLSKTSTKTNISIDKSKNSKNSKNSKKNKKLIKIKNKNLVSRKTNFMLEQIYYIEDIMIPELDTIMQNTEIQFKVMLLCSKIESIFIEFFEMVNNYIENSIKIDDKGNPYVSELVIQHKTYTNLSKLLTFLEYNKLPYNKHALAIFQDKQDELINSFYNLYNPVNSYLIHYNDPISKKIIKNALNNFKLCKPYNLEEIDNNFKRIDIAYKVQVNILDSINLTVDTLPKSVKYASEDLTRGLSKFISNRYSAKLPHHIISNTFIKLWECMTIFNLVSKFKKDNTFRVFHICEAPGQMILSCKYFVDQKRKNITDYQWIANSLNPFNYENKIKYGKPLGDDYGLIRENPQKWLWGADNTGDITRVKNIKWFKEYINRKFIAKDANPKLDLIVGDGGLGTGNDTLLLQKLDLAQVIMVLACSSIDGACVIKHFTPYITNHPETLDATSFFVSFLYMYYVSFDEVSLFKPYSSNPDSGEFYVIGKGFKGIEDSVLERLYKILDNFKVNDALISKDMLPETFLMQVSGFIETMANYNIQGMEKTNLLLTCYKYNKDTKSDKSGKSDISIAKINKLLHCNKFLDENNIENILVPRYNKWIKIYEFV
jgi:hypothetical protein